MHFDGISLTLERKDCTACAGSSRRAEVPRGYQPVFGFRKCGKCNGTGRRGSGKCRECNGDYQRSRRQYDANAAPAGFVTDYDTVARLEQCPKCHGAWEAAEWENFTDYAPQLASASLPLRIVRQDRGASWNESYLGIGCLWSVVDYGAAWAMSDEDLESKVAADLYNRRVQACKIVAPYSREDKEAALCDYVAVVVTRGGYSLRAVFTGDETGDAARELSVSQGFRVGNAVFAAGGNGTLAAATTKRTSGEA